MKYKISKNEINKLYWIKNLTLVEIGKLFNCSWGTIRQKMIKYGIKRRPHKGENVSNYNPEKHKKHYCIELNCNNEISYLNYLYGNKRCRACSKKGYRHPYWKGGLDRLPICLDCNKRVSSIYAIRCKQCHIKYYRGRNHYYYIDGRGREPYPLEFNNDFKELVRKRDNYACQNCDKKQSELKGLFKKLDIHHIDYNKENLNPNNLITACKSCNIKANFNRDYWYAYFTYIMKERKNL